MKKILGKIFGSDEIINAGISGIDKAIFSAEEKQDYHLKFLSAYEPFKLAQRFLAIMFSSVFLFVFLIASAVLLVGGIIDDQQMIDTSKALIELETKMLGWIIITIVAFYFAGGTVNSFRQMRKRKQASN